MPSRRSAWPWLVAKEWRELVASRAWWIMLALAGPLVGLSFISAVRVYAEASGLGGTSAGVGEAFSPLVGIWAPTFSAYELVAAFLLPFVAIRLVGGDRLSGALKLELQRPMWPMAASAPKRPCWALAGSSQCPLRRRRHRIMEELWRQRIRSGARRGGSRAHAQRRTDHRPRVRNRDAGREPSTAAILTLAVTVGTWVCQLHRRRERRLVGAPRGLHTARHGRGVPARPGATGRGGDRAGLVGSGRASRRFGFASASPLAGGFSNRVALAAVATATVRLSPPPSSAGELGPFRRPAQLLF